jgi:hypothetical protein
VVTVSATVLSVPLTLATDSVTLGPATRADLTARIAGQAACTEPICYVEVNMVDGSTALTIHLVYPTTDPSTPSGSADTAAVNATASATALAGAVLFFGTADASSLSSALGQQVTAVAPTTMQQDQRRPLAITSTATPPSGAGGGGSGDSRSSSACWVLSKHSNTTALARSSSLPIRSTEARSSTCTFEQAVYKGTGVAAGADWWELGLTM